MARLHHPDVAVLDLQMPGLDGISVAEQLHTQLPDCATLIVTSHGRPGHLKRALAAGVRRVPAQNRFRAGPRRRRPHRPRRRTVRRPPTRRRSHQHRRQPPHQPGDRRPGTRRRRHPDRGHRPAGRAVPRHRPQLPLLRRHQTRRRQPARSRPTRPRTRLDLTDGPGTAMLRAAALAGPFSPGGSHRPGRSRRRTGAHGVALVSTVEPISCARGGSPPPTVRGAAAIARAAGRE